ncbi:MAG: Zn-dependent hydrolase [Caldilineaceae bacterium]|nr:Zn-dependent hydrolase [Caldilineaceae bacterium]
MSTTLNPQRAIAELQELRALTGNDDGAQRVAWTPTWATARAWYQSKLAELPVETHQDEAGNLWSTLPGAAEQALLIGGHLDSVPNGGWLDGCLNILAGLAVLRRLAAQGQPPVTVRLVDWADEEGARFGHSLLGSSAVSGSLQPAAAAALRDREGLRLADVVQHYGVDIYQAKSASKELANAAAYLELHIEQGPVLESMQLPLGAVIGTFGVERHSIRFTGQAAHAGSTPMHQRHDALGAAAKLALAIREIGKQHGGVCTCGRIMVRPNIPTAVVGDCEITLDQRHIDATDLATMLAEAKAASERFAQEEQVTVAWQSLWRIHPIPFHPQLITLCADAIAETSGQVHRLPSGPLHDAAEVARAGVPTVMLFVQSLRGLSHAKEEDTQLDHVAQSVVALDKLADKTIQWITSQG